MKGFFIIASLILFISLKTTTLALDTPIVPIGAIPYSNFITQYFNNILGSSCDNLMSTTGGVVVGFSANGMPACEKFENLVTPPVPTLILQSTNNNGDRLDADATRFVRSGESFMITWDPQYVRSCIVNWDVSSLGINSGSLLRVKSTMSVIAPYVSSNTSQSYTMSCVGLNGSNTGNKTISVQIVPGLPSLAFQASVNQVFFGGTSVLTWTGSNLASCRGTNGVEDWTLGTRSATGGIYMARPLSVNVNFTLRCTGLNGDIIEKNTGTIEVIHPTTPTILFGMSGSVNTVLNLGESRTLTWIVSDADRCEASDGWSGSDKGTMGIQIIVPMKNTRYTITCYNSKSIGGNTQTISSSAFIDFRVNTRLAVTMQTSTNDNKIIDGSKIDVSVLVDGMKSCTTTLNEVNGKPSDSHIFYTATGGFIPLNKYPNFSIYPIWSAASSSSKQGRKYIYNYTCTDVNGANHSLEKVVYVFLHPIIEAAIRVAEYAPPLTNTFRQDFVNGQSYVALPWTVGSGEIFGADRLLGYRELTYSDTNLNTKVYIGWISNIKDYSLVCGGKNDGIGVETLTPTWPIAPSSQELTYRFFCDHLAEDGTSFRVVNGDISVGIKLLPNNFCGDGYVASGETCDSGTQNGLSGSCNSSCTGIAVAAACGSRIGNIGSGRSATATSVGNCAEGNTVQDFRIVNDQLYYKNWEWYCVGNTNTVERVHCSAFSSDTPPSSPPITPTPLRNTCNPGEFRAPSGTLCIIFHSTGDAGGAGGASTTTSSVTNPFR